MVRRRYGKARKKRNSDFPWIVVIVSVVAVIGGLAWWTVSRQMGQPRINSETGCPEEELLYHTVVVVDHTDSLDPSQLIGLRSLVDQIVDGAEVHEKISLFTLSDQDPFLRGPIFSRCLPRTGEHASELTENPRLLRRQFAADFREPLEQTFGMLEETATQKANQTPLIEALLELSARDDFIYQVPLRRLVLVSDMLQHSDLFSLYRTSPTAADGELNWDQILMRSPELAGVEVEIVLLLRDAEEGGNVQTNSLVSFWNRYFERVGASVQSIKKLN